MGKRKSSGKVRKSREKGINVDSEDEIRNEEEPDLKSRNYFYDEIDEFHESREQALLDAGKPYKVQYGSDNEDVYDLDLSDDDDEEIDDDAVKRYAAMKQKDEMESDIENEEDEIDETNWGKKKSDYYNTDYVDKNYQTYNESDIEIAEAEENEAKAIFKRWTLREVDTKDTETIIPVNKLNNMNEKDLSAMSRSGRLELINQEPSELANLIKDLKVKVIEIRDKYQPLMDMIRLGEIPDGPGADYINSKYQLLLNYSTNVCFYIMLKTKRESLKYHPIIEALLSYRKLLKELEPLDERFEYEMQQLLDNSHSQEIHNLPVDTAKEKLFKKKPLTSETAELAILTNSKAKKVKPTKATVEVPKSSDKDVLKINKKRKLESMMETEDEKKALEMYEYMKKGRKQKAVEIQLDEDKFSEEEIEVDEFDKSLDEVGEESGKRAITYQIAKNKGITPYRAKERRNPRVKYRNKYRKAQIRRKGQVSDVRKEVSKYGGEHSGIKLNSVRSIKLK